MVGWISQVSVASENPEREREMRKCRKVSAFSELLVFEEQQRYFFQAMQPNSEKYIIAQTAPSHLPSLIPGWTPHAPVTLIRYKSILLSLTSSSRNREMGKEGNMKAGLLLY